MNRPLPKEERELKRVLAPGCLIIVLFTLYALYNGLSLGISHAREDAQQLAAAAAVVVDVEFAEQLQNEAAAIWQADGGRVLTEYTSDERMVLLSHYAHLTKKDGYERSAALLWELQACAEHVSELALVAWDEQSGRLQYLCGGEQAAGYSEILKESSQKRAHRVFAPVSATVYVYAAFDNGSIKEELGGLPWVLGISLFILFVAAGSVQLAAIREQERARQQAEETDMNDSERGDEDSAASKTEQEEETDQET